MKAKFVYTEDKVLLIERRNGYADKHFRVSEISKLHQQLIARLDTTHEVLDFSVRSLAHLDELLVKYADQLGPQLDDEQFYMFIGEQIAYFGGTFVQNHHGFWEDDAPLTRILIGISKTKTVRALPTPKQKFFSPINVIASNWDGILLRKKSLLYQIQNRLINVGRRKVSNLYDDAT